MFPFALMSRDFFSFTSTTNNKLYSRLKQNIFVIKFCLRKFSQLF